MKIGLFTDTYYPQLNGVANFVRYCAAFLNKKGHQADVFAPSIRGFKETEKNIHRIPSVLALPGLPDFIRLPIPIPHKTFLKMIRFDFDLIHAHGNGLFSLIGLAVARVKHVPFILTFHTQVGNYTHYFLKGKLIKPNLLNAILLKRFGNLCDGIITPSHKMKQELIQAGVKKEITVIPNFLDLSEFDIKKNNFLRSNFHIGEDKEIILSVGRLGKEKNLDFLLEIFAEVYFKRASAVLVIVGEGFEKNRLIELSKKLKVSDRVVFTSGIEAKLIPQVYTSADIFITPSISEVHPMVAIEAASAGLPLLVADDLAFAGLVENGRNGYMLPLEKDKFAQKIIELLSDKNKRKKFGQASKEIVSSKYHPEILSDKLLKYYEQALKDYQNVKKERLWSKFVKKLKFIKI